MSLRRESIQAYRALYRATARAAQDCGLHNGPGLLQYLSRRYGAESELHHKQLTQALRKIERQGEKPQRRHQQNRVVERARSKLLRQYQQYISAEIDRARALEQTLYQAGGNAAISSVLQALSAGVGNAAYQQVLESSILSFVEFEQKRASRDEVAEDATSERQNRIMLQALLPYAERLLLVHRTAIGELNRQSSLSYLTPWQVTEAIVGNRSGVSAVHLRVGRNHVVVEVDETYNKQIVYLCSTKREGGDSGSYEWAQEIERVEISESEEVQKTLFHSEFLFAASRICDALLHDSPLHPTRSTVIIGHAVGGSEGLILSLLLSQRGFEVANTISLGAPKALQGTRERYVAAINPIRVVLAGDPLVELPVTGAEGAPFVHVGEILLLSPPGTKPAAAPEEADCDNSGRLSGVRAAKGEADEGPSEPLCGNLTAEALSASLSDDSPESTVTPPDGDYAEHSSDVQGQQTDGAEADEEEELREALRVAEERYRSGFLVEDYVRHMQNPAVELTYAEGDEVWDDGDYEALKRSMNTEPIVTAEEHRVRDLRGPL